MQERTFLASLTTQSTVAEVPGFEQALEIGARARELADIFRARPELPGVLLVRDGRLASAISRRYYLDSVGRYLGMDLYLPRPIELMLERFEELGGALVVDADLPIPAAVRRGLERRPELTFEPVVVRGADGGGRLVDFSQLLLADSQVTVVRAGQMRQILNTVTDGLLLVGPDHVISGECSVAAESILELAHPGGRTFHELLTAGLEPERADLGRDYLVSLFDPRVIESLIVKINPLLRVVWRRPGGRPRTLAFRFARGTEGEEIRRVLVRIEDVTRAEELAAEVERERERAERRLTLAMAAVQIEPELLDAFLAAMERQRERLLELARASAPRADEIGEIDALFRRVHALKGEAGLLRLDSFQTALHRVEEELAQGRGGGGLRREQLAARSSELAEVAAEVRELRARLGARAAPAAEPPVHAGSAAKPLAALPTAERRAGDLAASLGALARRIADATGRRVEVDAAIAPEPFAEHEAILREALVQLVRNAVAHGVEPIDLRVAAGKPPAATIQIVVRRVDGSGWIEAIVQDDGRGIDFDAIRARAGEEAETLPESALVDLLFRSGFSTASESTEHAGRGVGLDLVHERATAAGGTIEVYTERGSYCAFRVLLPSPGWLPS